MKILALDTTTDHGSIAFSWDGDLVWQEPMRSADGYSHVLFQSLYERLGQSFRLQDIDLFAAASGPASFTGVRVGLATVKGLAEATGRGALGISNLQALASFGTEPLRAVLIDARRTECYAAVYDENLECRSEEFVGDPAAWLRSLPEERYEFISQSRGWMEGLLTSTRFAVMKNAEAPLHIASAVAECARQQIAAGKSMDPVALEANYVRRSDVNLFWHDR